MEQTQRVTVETVRHKPVGIITTTEMFVDGRPTGFMETATVPVYPIEPVEVAYEIAKAEQVFQDSALEHQDAAREIGRVVFRPEKRRLKEWHLEQARKDKLQALMASIRVCRHFANQSDELEGKLFRVP